jgi:hypothetical protein
LWLAGGVLAWTIASAVGGLVRTQRGRGVDLMAKAWQGACGLLGYEREDDRTATLCGKAAFCSCGSPSIVKLGSLAPSHNQSL